MGCLHSKPTSGSAPQGAVCVTSQIQTHTSTLLALNGPRVGTPTHWLSRSSSTTHNTCWSFVTHATGQT
eukprot:1725448-Rhodomonas_salina.1